MHCLKKLYLSFLIVFGSAAAFAQGGFFSLSNDFSVLRNFSPNQQFWSVGHTVQANFHLSDKYGPYAWISYYSPGRFENDFTARAKQPSTTPQTIGYRVGAKWNFRGVSVGWKQYFRGGFTNDSTWSLYGLAGFGLQFTRVQNSFIPDVDTTLYLVQPPIAGNDGFKRLTLDLGAGVEYPLGGDIYLYGDLRTWIPTSGYPSPYLHDTRRVPLPLILAAGVRILF